MKTLKYILIIGLLIYACESKNTDYEILNRTKIIKKDNCEIPILYPEIKGLLDKVKMAKLNEIFEDFAEHEYYAHNCDKTNIEKNQVTGNYKILLQTDSILSIEFQTLINRGGTKKDTVYHSLVINPKQKDTLKDRLLIIEPNEIIPNFVRGMIYPYIQKYSSENNDYVNLLAYETGSNYVITWAISEKNLIIYVGGEGEFFGHHKIEIPLSDLKEKTTANTVYN
jgi:hypothetical protein